MGYYFISIGGSGAKVMESLTHFCAAGLLPNKDNQEGLYVMAVDPDLGNGNLKRSSAALHSLAAFQDLAIGRETPLFKTRVKISQPFIWSPTEQDKTLDDTMAYQAYRGTPVGDLYEVLYTEEERHTMLNEGFRGRPAMGAAVMAKKAGTSSYEGDAVNDPAWASLIRAVKQDAKNGQKVKIFLAGSVFGGTGAAGMPTIARLLRAMLAEYVADGSVTIGGAFILPYFSFTPTAADRSVGIFASSENFLTNTKAALKYYASQECGYNAMYFIGDDVLSPVDRFSVGAASQQNDAHMVDFYGALAALDFYQSEDATQECAYIAHTEADSFQWADLPDIKMASGESVHIKDRFAQFARFIFSYVHLVKPVLSGLATGKTPDYQYPWFHDFLAGVPIDTAEVRSFEAYAESFATWLQQLEHSESGRRVELINPNAFTATPAGLDPAQLPTLAMDEDSHVTVTTLWHRLCEGNVKDKEYAQGFGRFLRLLYDSCEKA